MNTAPAPNGARLFGRNEVKKNMKYTGGFQMNGIELQSIKSMAMNYADPLRGKVLALVTTVEIQNIEKEALVTQIERLQERTEKSETVLEGIMHAGINTIPRPEVQWFAEQMELQLRENEHKGGWDNESRDFLLNRIEANYNALWAKQQAYGSQYDIEGTIRKAANIANFAMMIADNAQTVLPKAPDSNESA